MTINISINYTQSNLNPNGKEKKRYEKTTLSTQHSTLLKSKLKW